MERTIAERTLTARKRQVLAVWLDTIDREAKDYLPLVQLPYANDVWMALDRLRQHIEQCRHFVAGLGEE